MMKKFVVFLLLFISALNVTLSAQETSEEKEKRMQWFEDAKLGIFIHFYLTAKLICIAKRDRLLL